MKTGYITDDFSTLGGLASVAYGDPEYFREVQNQIYFASPTRFLDIQRPSDIFESFLGSRKSFKNVVLEAMENQYEADQLFADYVDVEFGADWREVVLPRIEGEFFDSLDSTEAYGLSLSDYVGLVTEQLLPNNPSQEKLISAISETAISQPKTGKDIELMSKVVSNNPQTKLSIPPLNARVDLSNSADLGYDNRGVEITSGYITPQQYWNDVAYPGMTGSIMPTGLKDSVSNGYVGYLSSAPLEQLFNPVGAQSVSDAPTSVYDPSIFGQFPDELQGDRDVFSVSLMGEKLNGYTTFDPATMSNGDFLDTSQVPQFEDDNKDPQGGLNPAARNFTTAF